MKKLLLLLSVMLLTFAANSQTLKTRSDGTFTQADTYIVGLNTLGIPFGTTPGLNGGLARNGQLYYNTTTKTVYVYDLATTSWKTVTPATDLSVYYTKTEVDNLFLPYGNITYNDARYAKLFGGNTINQNQIFTGNVSVTGTTFTVQPTGTGGVAISNGGNMGLIFGNDVTSKVLANANIWLRDDYTVLNTGTNGGEIDLQIGVTPKVTVLKDTTYVWNSLKSSDLSATIYPAPTQSIVLSGNSIGDGATSTPGNSFFEKTNVAENTIGINLSVGSTTLSNTRTIWATIPNNSASIKYIFIMGNVNDAAVQTPLATYRATWGAIIDSLISLKGYTTAKIKVIGAQWNGITTYGPIPLSEYAKADSVMAAQKGVQLIETFHYMQTHGRERLLSHPDVVHMNDAGHAVIFEKIMRDLNDAGLKGNIYAGNNIYARNAIYATVLNATTSNVTGAFSHISYSDTARIQRAIIDTAKIGIIDYRLSFGVRTYPTTGTNMILLNDGVDTLHKTGFGLYNTGLSIFAAQSQPIFMGAGFDANTINAANAPFKIDGINWVWVKKKFFVGEEARIGSTPTGTLEFGDQSGGTRDIIYDGSKYAIRGAPLQTTDLDNYVTDLSASYTSRSKIDKGYADATYAPISVAGTVTSITPGYGFNSSTPITNSGTMTIDTATKIVDKAYFNGKIGTGVATALSGKQSTITFGTGVQTALGVNVGSAGAFLVNGGAGGTPSSINLTNGTGLPYTGLTGTVPTWNQNTTGSAAKWTTGRTFWGQTADGTANVSGDMSNVGNFLPASANTKDIGSAGTYWRNIYAATVTAGGSSTFGNVTITNTLTPTTIGYFPANFTTGSIYQILINTNLSTAVQSASPAQLKTGLGYYTSGDIMVLGSGSTATTQSAGTNNTTVATMAALYTAGTTGGLAKSIRDITSATTITNDDYTINVTSGTFSQPLPATPNTGQIFYIANSGVGVVTVTTSGAPTIINAGQTGRFQYTGTSGIYVFL